MKQRCVFSAVWLLRSIVYLLHIVGILFVIEISISILQLAYAQPLNPTGTLESPISVYEWTGTEILGIEHLDDAIPWIMNPFFSAARKTAFINYLKDNSENFVAMSQQFPGDGELIEVPYYGDRDNPEIQFPSPILFVGHGHTPGEAFCNGINSPTISSSVPDGVIKVQDNTQFFWVPNGLVANPQPVFALGPPPTGNININLPDGSLYSGPTCNGVADGVGLVTFKTGDRYVATFQYGSMTGWADVKFNNGDAFEGFLLNGNLQTGNYTFKDGKTFTGDFKNNKPGIGWEVFTKNNSKVSIGGDFSAVATASANLSSLSLSNATAVILNAPGTPPNPIFRGNIVNGHWNGTVEKTNLADGHRVEYVYQNGVLVSATVFDSSGKIIGIVPFGTESNLPGSASSSIPALYFNINEQWQDSDNGYFNVSGGNN